MEYPFKKMHSREFSDSEIITNLITFVHSFYLNNNKQNADSSNVNSINSNYCVINTHRNSQSQNRVEQQSLFKEI